MTSSSFLLFQVWKHKKIWEGFVRCCQRAKPQSFHILLQLAPAQLKMAFETAPDLRQPLLKHVNAFSAHQVCKPIRLHVDLHPAISFLVPK